MLALNAVGSATYGREFCDRLMGHWGEYDLPQHEAAVRQLQEEGACDGRVAIMGEGAPSVRQDAAERIVDWVQRHAGEAPRTHARDRKATEDHEG